jgi:CHAD domain-containing protein
VAFELRWDESLSKGIRRITRKQLQDAQEQVARKSHGSRDEAVHEARKCLKKVRAILRLIRPAIGERHYRRENTLFRDGARPLTEVRDAKILVETVDKITKRFADRARSQSFAVVRKQLMKHQREVRKRVLEEENAFATVETVIREALERLDDWSTVPDRWSEIGKGVEQVYQQARQAFADAETNPSMKKLHEWRKSVKYLRYQLEILRVLWPAMMEPFVSQADHLGELLGDDHDLAVLRQMLTHDPERFGSPQALERLVALIDRRRQELEEEANFLGYRFFQDSPKDFAQHLKGYWTAWRKLGQLKLNAQATLG